MDLLAHIINGESRGEPFLGQVAVGAVVLNRVRAGGEYGSTVAEVIYRPGQFEPVRNGQINLTPTESCLLAARAAAQGQDPTGGALYFWHPDKTFSTYLWSRPFKIEIGCHRFTE
jgi:N-acetylmuramoyl-L-alanine amidase